MDQAIADVSTKIQTIEGLTAADTFALLRYVNRNLAKREGGPEGFETVKVPNDAEFRKNINIIAQQVDKVIQDVEPKNMSEFTNFLNVLRISEAELLVPAGLRQGITKKINQALIDSAKIDQFRELSIEQVCKIFSDLVHQTNFIGPAGSNMVSVLNRSRTSRGRKGEESEEATQGSLTPSTKDIGAAVRVLDQMTQVDLAFENGDFVVRALDRYFREQAIYDQLSITQKSRLLRAFAKANHELFNSFPILNKLTRDLYQSIEKLQPSDVNHILKAYEYLSSEVKNGTRLIRELNNSVVVSASNYPENVSIQFLLNYLHQIFEINSRSTGTNTGRDLFKEQRDKLIELLESKITRPD